VHVVDCERRVVRWLCARRHVAWGWDLARRERCGGTSVSGYGGGQVDVWHWARGQIPGWGAGRETGCG